VIHNLKLLKIKDYASQKRDDATTSADPFGGAASSKQLSLIIASSRRVAQIDDLFRPT
jgi:hypothetical protein